MASVQSSSLKRKEHHLAKLVWTLILPPESSLRSHPQPEQCENDQ